MTLVKLLYAGAHRDGGSYGAAFATDDKLDYRLWLERSRMPDAEGRHHRWLFEYRGADKPPECIPIVTGSLQEQYLILRLEAFLQHPVADEPTEYHLQQLTEMLAYIKQREPCFPADLKAAGFVR